MRTGLASIISLALLACGMPAAAQDEAVVLEPSTDWYLDYAETRCRILRTFGAGDDVTLLYLEQYYPSDDLSWLVAGSLVDELRASRRFTVQFGPGEEPYSVDSRTRLTYGEYGRALSSNSLTEQIPADRRQGDEEAADGAAPIVVPALSTEQGRSIDWIEFSRGDRRIRLDTGNLGNVFEAMNACMENYMASWGVDFEVLRTQATPPAPKNLPELVRRIQVHYPGGALARNQSARLLLRVLVDELGYVASCYIIDMSAADNFDDHACDVFEDRAEFEPALDTAGNAMPSYYVTTVIYSVN